MKTKDQEIKDALKQRFDEISAVLDSPEEQRKAEISSREAMMPDFLEHRDFLARSRECMARRWCR